MAHLGVAGQIVFEARGDVVALGDDLYALGNVSPYFVEKQGEVGAAEDDGVDEWVLGEQFLKRVLDEIVGSWPVELIILDKRHPHGTGLSHDGAFGIEFLYFQLV